MQVSLEAIHSFSLALSDLVDFQRGQCRVTEVGIPSKSFGENKKTPTAPFPRDSAGARAQFSLGRIDSIYLSLLNLDDLTARKAATRIGSCCWSLLDHRVSLKVVDAGRGGRQHAPQHALRQPDAFARSAHGADADTDGRGHRSASAGPGARVATKTNAPASARIPKTNNRKQHFSPSFPISEALVTHCRRRRTTPNSPERGACKMNF